MWAEELVAMEPDLSGRARSSLKIALAAAFAADSSFNALQLRARSMALNIISGIGISSPRAIHRADPLLQLPSPTRISVQPDGRPANSSGAIGGRLLEFVDFWNRITSDAWVMEKALPWNSPRSPATTLGEF